MSQVSVQEGSEGRAIRFFVIGITDQSEPHFSPELCKLISRAQVFSGGIRHRGIVEPYLPASYIWIDVTVPLEKVFVRYRDHQEIVVFASGDPLFYGYAGTLLREFPSAEIRVYPVFNSLQMLAHKLSLPYEDMRVVSLTGRPWIGLDRALIEREKKIGLLTDRKHTPSAIAKRLIEYGFDEYSMTIGELLGNRNQEHLSIRMSLHQAADYEALSPNVVLLQAEEVKPRYFGIDESRFSLLNGRARMITKMPIRLSSLAALGLPGRRCLWDIGFCTGSVSIEAKLLSPQTQVESFEIRPEGEELMRENARRFGCPGIEVHIGDFFSFSLEDLPHPDAVFIGGHGGRLVEMIQRVAPYMVSGGVLVFNSVSSESRSAFDEGCRLAGLLPDLSRIIKVDEHNPIDIVRATKPSV
ncbi:Precorrin-6Y C(5,15)-methyltransferase [decarboxylating] [Porphyromonas crevioricanis]|uniref:Precorrin-6Y C(5,15)-methyltransferase [decarboxylating] n=1 Tax=Porphyromonas crevioricanis TaxID=393921 RepID=A0A2X4STR9_9PORP|nr:bifunctional cobalt-precorrin-7 (C(5))-methyltransferase/cobalt-precorrin-6B (C(15))-methyltransferase [Porphyromonas crevioricanis]GAD06656.1 cobalt-precorrin-6y C5-methyltransferase/ cobalt-precorrin-6y C15-methyltransferase [Porphyromonas crevioricanis JCM 13913]SQH73231.1 Precorrin-6Y C(5,15)-methyltransferase [decarboxylating] [Porphyromonas crevioricanis]